MLRVVAVRPSDGPVPLLQSDEDSGMAVPSPTPRRSLPACSSPVRCSLLGPPDCLTWSGSSYRGGGCSAQPVCARRERPSPPARRPSAGEMPPPHPTLSPPRGEGRVRGEPVRVLFGGGHAPAAFWIHAKGTKARKQDFSSSLSPLCLCGSVS